MRGGRIEFGTGDDADFTPVELLLAAIGGCATIDADVATSRHVEPLHFSVSVSGFSSGYGWLGALLIIAAGVYLAMVRAGSNMPNTGVGPGVAVLGRSAGAL